MKQGKITALAIIGGILVVPVAFFLFLTTGKNQYKKIQIYGNKEVSANGDTIYHTIPPYTFLNYTGDSISNETFNGSIIIADFFFATCPSICPIMSKQLKRVQDKYKDVEEVKIISHTVNPEHDSLSVLQQYALNQGAIDGKWFFVTGKKKDLYQMARKGYLISAEEGDGGEHDFIHSPMFVLIDKERRIRGFYDGTNTKEVDRLIDEILVLYVEDKEKVE